jgi:eukaryotic-like serine/threonine-protein kinase
MNEHESARRSGDSTLPVEDTALRAATSLAALVRERWRAGERPDAAAVLATNEVLRQCRSVGLGLAYEEFRLRRQGGESLTPQNFARRFPSLERSLCLLIGVHELLSHDPEFQMLQGKFRWPEPGERFLQVELNEELGRGTFGRVFLASEPALGNRLTVVKIAPHGGAEAKILGQLDHPNIVPVYSVSEDQATGLTGFCMPYLGRATLNDVLDRVFVTTCCPRRARVILDAIHAVGDDADERRKTPPDSFLARCSYVDGALHIARQLAEALAYAHGRGIRHCDLKPSNVLMSEAGRPLLLDFNLSEDERFAACRAGGTLPYMAPEVLAAFIAEGPVNGAQRFDPRSDIFSLGAVIFELLTGSLPFGTPDWGETFVVTARRLYERQRQGVQPARSSPVRVGRHVASVIERCLSFDVDDRPRTAAELADALRRELTWRRRAGRWLRDHRLITATAAAAVVAMVVAAGSFVMTRPPYKIREFQAGTALTRQQNLPAAIIHFSNAIDADSTYYDARVARGEAWQRSRQFSLAYSDFELARRQQPAPMLDACMGYCLNRLGMVRIAAQSYQLAIDSGGATAAVLNNLGFTYHQLKRIPEAEQCLRQAVQRAPRLQAPRVLLVLVFIYHELHGKPLPQDAFEHARRALELGPVSAELYRDEAMLYAVISRRDPRCLPQAIDYVRHAVACGAAPEFFQHDAAFSALSGNQAFLQALRARRSRTCPPQDYLLDPLEHR